MRAVVVFLVVVNFVAACAGVNIDGVDVRLETLELAQRVAQVEVEEKIQGLTFCGVEEFWTTAKVTHFDPLDTRTFQQKYYVNSEFYQPGGGTYLYVGAEGPLSASTACGGFWYDLAKENGARLLAIEHRFYGESQPFAYLTTENLVFLSATHAMADIVSLVTNLKANNWTEPEPWIAFGGSYAGSVAAYLRLDYPHLFAGSVASSAPVEAEVDFTTYQRVGTAAAAKFRPKCMEFYTPMMLGIYTMIAKDPEEFQDIFNPCVPIVNDSKAAGSLEYLTFPDVGGYMQYYHVWEPQSQVYLDTFCDTLMAKADEGPIAAFRYYLETYGYYIPEQGNNGTCLYNYFDGAVIYQKDLRALPFNYRSWFWQKCSMFGYFRTVPGSANNADYYRSVCTASYGTDVFPDEAFWDNYYGGWKNPETNIFFPNGGLDGWSSLSVLEKNVFRQGVGLVPDASHCEDMYGVQYEQTPGMTEMHDSIRAQVLLWIKEWNRRH